MSNHYYMISEIFFHKEKENDPKIYDFVAGTGIDLSRDNNLKAASVKDIRESVINLDLILSERYIESSRLEFYIKNQKSENLYLIFSDVLNENDEVMMFEIERSSNHYFAIDFIKRLSDIYCNYLFYCDSGAMSLITADKDNEKIFMEMN